MKKEEKDGECKERWGKREKKMEKDGQIKKERTTPPLLFPRQELLLAVQNDAVDSVRRKICDALSELARNLFDENGNNLWPEVLKFLFELANSENPALR